MAIPVITAALALAEMVPSLTRWFTPGRDKEGQKTKVVEKVVEIAKNLTHTKDAATALSVLEKNPSLMVDFQKEVLRYDRELEMSFLDDRQDARSRDIQFLASGKTNIRADIMVVAAAVGLMICLGSLAFFKETLPGEAVGIISTIAGIFGSCLKDAYAFEFGSSRGSKAKDAAVLLNAARWP